MSLQFILDFLKHRYSANNRHGTHSPFVYQLADEVVYNFNSSINYPETIASKKNRFNNRLAKLIYRLAKNHQTKSVLIIEDKPFKSQEIFKNTCAEKIVCLENNDLTSTNTLPQSIGIAYIHQQENIFSIFDLLKKNTNEDSLLIFNGIYSGREQKQDWQKIKLDNSVTITIDLFWLGLVYFKKGRVKANYKLKF